MQLNPSALHAVAEDVVADLGWQLADPTTDGTVHLYGPLERHIGMRLLHNGGTIQLWATGGTAPDDAPDDALPLPEGRRWHTPCHISSLDADQDPCAELLAAIQDRLLPVFDSKPACVGHRPWDPQEEQHDENDDVDPADVEATVQAAVAAGVELDDEPDDNATPPVPPTTEDHTEPVPEPEQPDRSHKLAQASWRTGARRYAENRGAEPDLARAFGEWYIAQGHQSPKDAPLATLYDQWHQPQTDQAPDAPPQPTAADTNATPKRTARKRTAKKTTT